MITNDVIVFEKVWKKRTFRDVFYILLCFLSTTFLYAQDTTQHYKHHEFSTVTIQDSTKNFGINRLKAIDGTAIYDAKKNEVILLKEMDINLAANSSRQIFAKVPGVNVWESDAAGLQLGVATRGLSPNRTSNFNTRQNGYDMSADALGYPESYYVPPAEAVEKIEVVRGAASLQYGPQFGGMMNYVLKGAPSDKKIEWNSYTTAGSYKLVSSFNSLGGTYKGLSYYGLFNYKQGNAWQANSSFKAMTAFATLKYQFNEKISLKADYTFSDYTAQQPGGLTDAQFSLNPRQSRYSRNWFATNWNILALNFDYKISTFHLLNVRWWGFLGSRDAVGFLLSPTHSDDFQGRQLIKDTYKNMGAEARYVWKYFIKEKLSSLLVGGRFYIGKTTKIQGYGTNDSNANFNFAKDSLQNSNYVFPGMNIALFAENSFSVTKKLKIVPGVRYEYISTLGQGGYYPTDNSDHIASYVWQTENRSLKRSFVLLGLGVSYDVWKETELYANFSQNYRGITFTDMRLQGVNQKIDPNLHDEKGWNIDIGWRGNISHWFSFDASVYWLEYDNRIGQLPVVDSAYSIYVLTTNIGKSRSVGAEVFAQADIFEAAKISKRAGHLVLYITPSYTNAKYTKSQYLSVVGKYLESAPRWMFRAGITYSYRSFSTTVSANYVSKQYSDASNVEFSPAAIYGAIPAYYVLDWNAKYSIKCFQLIAGVNNFTNNIYFTRRATSYPGPGIITAQPLTFYVTLGISLNEKIKENHFSTFQ